LTSPTYAGTLTGSTDILNIGSGQLYKDASGNVGIGTSSPTQKLQVAGSQLLSSPGSAVYTYFDGTSNSIGRKVTGELAITVASGSPITFVNSTTEQMRIDSSGNVGIGTSSPSTFPAKFAVNGSVASGGQNYSAGFSDAVNSTFRIGHQSGLANLITDAALGLYTSSIERMRIDSSGNLLVNTTVTPTYGLFTGTTKNGSPDIRWEWGPSIVNGVYYVIPAGGGSGVYLTSGNTSWSSNSDLRLKNVTGTYENALNDIVQIEPIKFTWKADSSNKPQVGLSAQSVQKVIPEAVDTEALSIVGDNEEKYLSVRYTEVIPLLVASIKELKAIIDTQQEQINSLLGK
jgi:hypothetical protein